ncbi:hypothetical protein LTR10_015167 [Elasticomyces elasticus]|uniref:Heterokaryon incompatibility domain-containing protein n=1 Tax=Exophiala sideris TaxID=1016849 RepID=A0ABR0JEW1_9EURO|nr:hypothetical protein LTR10_015167 [Elasticomyces elasticus]KAK5032640.1 hypothetical protein LTS07_004050 [Exophiala sideris]KAK5037179.1 hypothetical protein LTR13_004984 [Exophiala sideris]KAK5062165.1 hypothetical protein LTR69_004523 [Exophiala sideris]KAK5182337.1 hypothetical protein LTR44_005348 [Eurotiomycetes sp. CCFEE 6388]
MPPKYLLNSATLRLEHGTKLLLPKTEQFVKYAILSHRWGDEDQELSFDDIQLNPLGVKDKLGYQKLKYACKQARTDGYSHIWLDTCCIDKKSSADLSESINSMYSWYENAEQCYAYLEDVNELSKIALSEWFHRGWTLQELIAPKTVVFFSKSWTRLGERTELSDRLSKITSIDIGVLCRTEKVDSACVARRMSWASKRVTSRPEDIAYCLMGIFNVNMTMIYGEGEKAFIRLQEEIMKDSDDESIFAWRDKNAPSNALTGLLATHPRMFEDSRGCTAYDRWWDRRPAYSKTNHGLEITLPLSPFGNDVYIAALDCSMPDTPTGYVGIYLKRLNTELSNVGPGPPGIFKRLNTELAGPSKQQYARTNVGEFWLSDQMVDRGQVSAFFVRKPNSESRNHGLYPSVLQLGKGPAAADGFTLYHTSGSFSRLRPLVISDCEWIPTKFKSTFKLDDIEAQGKIVGQLFFKRQDPSNFVVFLASLPGRGELAFRTVEYEHYDNVKTLTGFLPCGAKMASKFETIQCTVRVRAENGIKYYIVDLSIRRKPSKPKPKKTISSKVLAALW